MQPGVHGSLVEHPQLLLCGVVPREAKQALEESGHRVEGGALMVGRALPALDASDLIAEPLGELVDQPALADAGLARNVGHGAAAARGPRPGRPWARPPSSRASPAARPTIGGRRRAAATSSRPIAPVGPRMRCRLTG